ncbi:MAG: GNAT family N-acetyltransferase [Clostridia bacterium]|nr:GNAT family N-acetyltransferase [Clostridia bacterium]
MFRLVNGDIIIREGVPEDAEALIAYLNTIGGESDNLSFGAGEFTIPIEREREFLKTTLEKDKSCLLVVLRGDRLIADGSVSQKPRRMGHRAELGISVLRSEWGRGVGTLLMEALIAYARDHGLEYLDLEVRSDNEKAIRLYKKLGFTVCGTIPGYMKVNGENHDVLTMCLDLR